MLNSLLLELAQNPRDPYTNYLLGTQYQSRNQLASAVSFYLTAAEYGYKSDPEISYNALLRIALCFEEQCGRWHSVVNALQQAITFIPNRPEGYYLLSRAYEREQKWSECYLMSSIGIQYADNKSDLSYDFNYQGVQSLIFEKAVAAWWVGRPHESKQLFVTLLTSHLLDETHRNSIFSNLRNLGVDLNDGVNNLEPLVTNYRKFFGATATTIFDIGTRDGDDANYLKEQLNGENVYAIDANPEAIAEVQSKYPWMKVIEVAVSNYDGTTTFQKVNSEDKNLVGSSSMYADKLTEQGNMVDTITVAVRKMDGLLQSAGLTTILIDVVKIDVEGYSWEVLKGFGDKLQDVKLLHVETEKESTHPEHHNSAQVRSFMEQQGFFLADVSYEWGAGIEDQIWVNPRFAIRNMECFVV